MESIFDMAANSLQEALDAVDSLSSDSSAAVIKKAGVALRSAKNIYSGQFGQLSASAQREESDHHRAFLIAYDMAKKRVLNLYPAQGDSVPPSFTVSRASSDRDASPGLTEISRSSTAYSRATSPTLSLVDGNARALSPELSVASDQQSELGPISSPPDVMNALGRMLLRQDAFDRLPPPFDGEPVRYRAWRNSMRYRVAEAALSPLQELRMLECSTKGSANEVVTLYASSADNPAKATQQIWNEFERRFGRKAVVVQSIRDRLARIREASVCESDPISLQTLADLCHSISSLIGDIADLSIYNHAEGLRSIRSKLSAAVDARWRKTGVSYRRRHGDHPPFSYFADFICRLAEDCGDDDFRPLSASGDKPRSFAPSTHSGSTKFRQSLSTSVSSDSNLGQCLLHPNGAAHKLRDCGQYKRKTPDDRWSTAAKNRVCFRCLERGHRFRRCRAGLACAVCKSTAHHTLLHRDRTEPEQLDSTVEPSLETATTSASSQPSTIPTNLTSCSTSLQKITGKTFLVYIRQSGSPTVVKTYATIDEGSDSTFATPRLLRALGADTIPTAYSLTTMDRCKTTREAQLARNLYIRGVDEALEFALPDVLSCDQIPNHPVEQATPELLDSIPHLRHLAVHFRQVDPQCTVTLLIGRNATDLMRTECMGDCAPFAHRTPLGWALMGQPTSVPSPGPLCLRTSAALIHDVFATSPSDESAGLSRDDVRFLDVLERRSRVDPESGRLEMPLPFRVEPPDLPSNRDAVLRRMTNTLRHLAANDRDRPEAVDYMSKLTEDNHVEQLASDNVTDNAATQARFYLPVFSVRHPKTNKLRLVFDSAASFHGKSLNDVLLQGPDYNNSLLAVLLRFRESPVGFSADIKKMFLQFLVAPEHRDFQRFLWWKDNDPTGPLVDYRARCHIFGNKSSPSVAIYGLRKAAKDDATVSHFISTSAYVDDILASVDTVNEAVDLLRRSQQTLSQYGIELHKFASNSPDVMSELLRDHSKEPPTLVNIFDDLCASTQRALGMEWNIRTDCFSVVSSVSERPFTRRGVLSVLNAPFDPFGFAAPVVLAGRLLLREIMSVTSDFGWDDELPGHFRARWEKWKSGLSQSGVISVPRCLRPTNIDRSEIVSQSLHVFSDASSTSIGYVVYLLTESTAGNRHVAFVCANSKLAPRSGITIPRLELCAAVEAAKSVAALLPEFRYPPEFTRWYTDSGIVLGYLRSVGRRFSVYVTNRIALIHRLTNIDDWRFIPTELNPADKASRPATFAELSRSPSWFEGPTFLRDIEHRDWQTATVSDDSMEVLRDKAVVKTSTRVISTDGVFRSVYERLSNWTRIVGAVSAVLYARDRFLSMVRRVPRRTVSVSDAENAVVMDAQLACNVDTQKEQFAKLSPFPDYSGAIRVGGRLSNSSLPFHVKHPLLVPPDHVITQSLVRYCHILARHQGRRITTGMLRERGFFVIHASSLVRACIQDCVLCRRFRGVPASQQMAPLPTDRVSESAPFVHTGLDVFGPYTIRGLSTRSSSAVKAFILIFTCLVSRAFHAELLEGLDSASFINAFRRFTALRGQPATLRSDRGKNFVGAVSAGIADLGAIARHLSDQGTQWIFNTPTASHHGGVWERQIRTFRSALDNSLSLLGNRRLTRDEFTTVLAECCAICNATPLVDSSNDANEPPISPAMLLTGRNSAARGPAALEDISDEDILAYGRRRWRRIQALADEFWRHWRRLYLHGLIERQKWARQTRNFEVGDVVFLTEKGCSRNDWPCARVTRCHPSSDGLIRSVTVKTANNREFVRPTSALILSTPAVKQPGGV